MSSYSPTPRQPTFQDICRTFVQDPGLPFADVLSQEDIDKIAAEESVDFGSGPNCVYTPAVTLWAWLAQCLSPSKSCVAAVARVLVLRIAMDLPACSTATGGYCTARGKLPERFLQRLTCTVGAEVERLTPPQWRCLGRRVLFADGSEVTMPDTPENQAAYPQNGAQKAGLGFPMMRLVVLLAFASACAIGAAFGPCKGKQTSETGLLRQLFAQLLPGDILVADRFYCSFWLIALLLQLKVDIAFRLHQSRKIDYQKAKRLGKNDYLVTWTKPPRPEGIDEQTWAAIPETMTLRLVRIHIEKPGCRCKVIDVVTTLVDAKKYSKKDIEELYGARWHVELDIRTIKQTMKMDVLTCQTPEMVRKEVWTHLLAYNLVRKVMAQTAQAQGKRPRQLSFAAAMQTLDAFRWLLLLKTGQGWTEMAQVIWVAIGTHEVGKRPGRCEPREVKRRPKQFPYLKKPRKQAREELLQRGN